MIRTVYDHMHRLERERRVAVYQPGDRCAIGGEPLRHPAELLDLAHDHANGGYLPGLSCRYHNRAERAARGNRQRWRGSVVRTVTVAKRWW